jgi:Tfp pilus assembly protein PilO
MTRAKIVVVLGPALVVAAGWWTFVWNARANEVAAAQERVEVIEDRTATATSRLRKAQEFAAEGAAAQARLATVAGWIPAEPDIAGFVEAHDLLVRSVGVTVRSLSPGPREAATRDASTPAGIASIRVAVNVEGGGGSVESYLRGLYSLSRLVVIDTIKLAPGGEGTVRLDLVLRAFYEDTRSGTPGGRGTFGF